MRKEKKTTTGQYIVWKTWKKDVMKSKAKKQNTIEVISHSLCLYNIVYLKASFERQYLSLTVLNQSFLDNRVNRAWNWIPLILYLPRSFLFRSDSINFKKITGVELQFIAVLNSCTANVAAKRSSLRWNGGKCWFFAV